MKKLAQAIGGAVAAVALLAGCSGGSTGTDTAAEFPKKGSTIEWIVPSAAGAANDILARIMAPAMQETLGANVKVINKEGGSQIIGLNYAANAKPDGHTIVYTNIPSILGRYLDPSKKAGFDRESFAPIGAFGSNAIVIGVNKNSPYKTIKDLFTAVQASPGTITVGTDSRGGDDHINLRMLEDKLGLKFNVVHYNSGSEKISSVVAGETDFALGGVSSFFGQFKSGEINILAVIQDKPSPFLPEVPTLESQGYQVDPMSNAFRGLRAGRHPRRDRRGSRGGTEEGRRRPRCSGQTHRCCHSARVDVGSRRRGTVDREGNADQTDHRRTAEVERIMSMTLTPLAEGVIERFASVPAANVADAQERFGVASGLVPMWRGARLAGPALTVWTRPGDNLYIHQALDLAQPGDIIVINGLGDLSRALIGDLIGIRAKALGIGGFVIDGAVRDADALAECGMPVFARAVTPAGPYKHGPGRLQQPVAIAGVVVLPGDIVVADADGVVVVQRAEAERVLADAEKIEATEAEKRIAYASGKRP